MSTAESEARRDIFELFVEWQMGERFVLDNDLQAAAERIASSYGVYPVDTFTRVVLIEAAEVFVGRIFGVGPRARKRDKVRWWLGWAWSALRGA